ncbi:LamG domain-containing protein [Candidatus Nanosalina sp. VS9-1]|uniref:LamG domain-containing protein n=1 Tax=Candidatus Nanosalina sp. VS9-1 TaxID=3388566 RepID=UPI0039E0181A
MVLKAYWPLDETSGSTAYDVRNGNNGSVGDGGDSTVLGGTGILGSNCYSFDGNNDYVSVPQSESISAENSVSFSAWTLPQETQQAWAALVQRRLPDPTYYDAVLRAYNGDRWEFAIYNGSEWKSARSPSSYSEGNWQHVTGVYDGATAYLYVNGELLDTVSHGKLTGSINDVLIGRYDDYGSNNNFFSGKIQHVRIYDHALTPQEVQYLYSVGKRGLHVSSERTL